MGQVVLPDGWPAPVGYAPGMLGAAGGRLLVVSGQVGTDEAGHITSKDFVRQFDRALDNVMTVVAAGGGRAGDVVSLTVFVLDKLQYLASTSELALAWRRRTEAPYPAHTLVEVSGLVTPGALVEIQALAVVSGPGGAGGPGRPVRTGGAGPEGDHLADAGAPSASSGGRTR